MFTIDYNYKNSVIRIAAKGKLSAEIIVNIIRELKKNVKGGYYLILNDMRAVSFDFDVQDLDSMAQRIESYIEPDTVIYQAILIDSPRETALSTLFDMAMQKKYSYRIFSTELAALHWLNIYRKTEIKN